MPKVFDYVKAINAGVDIVNHNEELTPEDAIRDYSPFLTARALSYHPDTLFAAHLMNTNSALSPKMQYDFFINTVRPRTRFSKWAKPVASPELDLVIAYFKCNRAVAKQYLGLLTAEDLVEIEQRLRKGGSDG